jgi:hypothetical protein
VAVGVAVAVEVAVAVGVAVGVGQEPLGTEKMVPLALMQATPAARAVTLTSPPTTLTSPVELRVGIVYGCGVCPVSLNEMVAVGNG